MKRARKLLLFDIDGTLVDTGGAGLSALRDGFFDAFPEHCERDFPPLELGGATDHGVVMGLFAHYGLSDSEWHRRRFFEGYLARLETHLLSFSELGRARALPGAVSLLERLSGRSGLCLSVLTGNLREGARIKLRHFGMERFFIGGAYGDDHHDRNQLGPIARRRAQEACGEDFDPADIVVIGDTVRDIACARAFGARVLAVATGASSREQLAAAGPDGLLDDLGDPDEVDRWLDKD